MSVVLFYLAATKIVVIGAFSPEVYSLQFALCGVILYSLGQMFDEDRNKILRYGGIAGPYFGAIYKFSNYFDRIEPILALFMAGGLSFVESRRMKSTVAKYLSSGILVLATEWFFIYLKIHETQVYTVTWAFYFGALAYLRFLKKDKRNQDILTCISLFILTVPLAGQALTDQSYALFLILEGMALVVGGMALNYKLIRSWGIVALVGTVIYQLRDFFLGLPSWAIFGVIGILILAGSIYLLSRRKE